MKFKICVPSWHRTGFVLTSLLYKNIRVYVAPDEFDEYVKNNPNIDIVKCREGIQGSLPRVNNYILDEEFKSGTDWVIKMDDDNQGIYIWENKKEILLDESMLNVFIEKYCLVAEEWGKKLWGVNVNPDKQSYREYSPFSTLSYIGGPFMAIHKSNQCRFDEKIPLKEDYDFTLQNINLYRGVLRVNKACYRTKQCEQVGGCATYRNIDKEIAQNKLLQKKWGNHIVRFESLENSRSHNTTKQRKFDINPIISVPIRGI